MWVQARRPACLRGHSRPLLSKLGAQKQGSRPSHSEDTPPEKAPVGTSENKASRAGNKPVRNSCPLWRTWSLASWGTEPDKETVGLSGGVSADGV